ncbi:hypothetical protein BASA60_009160 [Batrachochytrium salamandrivorans]|nr:hypothetical protein BASA60_009160 [Batrachochytrium salamandrivorans]KAH9266436.1 hypothetical protein BASA83_010554 [Batrachochytrium salamandrivorans]
MLYLSSAYRSEPGLEQGCVEVNATSAGTAPIGSPTHNSLHCSSPGRYRYTAYAPRTEVYAARLGAVGTKASAMDNRTVAAPSIHYHNRCRPNHAVFSSCSRLSSVYNSVDMTVGGSCNESRADTATVGADPRDSDNMISLCAYTPTANTTSMCQPEDQANTTMAPLILSPSMATTYTPTHTPTHGTITASSDTHHGPSSCSHASLTPTRARVESLQDNQQDSLCSPHRRQLQLSSHTAHQRKRGLNADRLSGIRQETLQQPRVLMQPHERAQLAAKTRFSPPKPRLSRLSDSQQPGLGLCQKSCVREVHAARKAAATDGVETSVGTDVIETDRVETSVVEAPSKTNNVADLARCSLTYSHNAVITPSLVLGVLSCCPHSPNLKRICSKQPPSPTIEASNTTRTMDAVCYRSLKYSPSSPLPSTFSSDAAAAALARLMPPSQAHPHQPVTGIMRSHSSILSTSIPASTNHGTHYFQKPSHHRQQIQPRNPSQSVIPQTPSITSTIVNFTSNSSTHRQKLPQPPMPHHNRHQWVPYSALTTLSPFQSDRWDLACLPQLPTQRHVTCADGKHQVILRSIDAHSIADLRSLNATVLPVIYNDRFYDDVVQIHPTELSCLAYLNGKVVGGISCRRELCSNSQYRIYIMTLSVLAPYRRLSIGSMLLESIIGTSDLDCELDHVCLHVQTSNQQALGFYERNGFYIHSRLDGYYGRNEGVCPPHAFLLRRDLKRHSVFDVCGGRCLRSTAAMAEMPRVFSGIGQNEIDRL